MQLPISVPQTIRLRARRATDGLAQTHIAIELCKGTSVLGVWLLTLQDAKDLQEEIWRCSQP